MRVVATRTTWTFSIQQKNNDNKKKRAGRRRRSRWAPFFFPLSSFTFSRDASVYLFFASPILRWKEKTTDQVDVVFFLFSFKESGCLDQGRGVKRKEKNKKNCLIHRKGHDDTSRRCRHQPLFFFSSSFALQLICIGFVFDSDLLDGLMSFNVERLVLFFFCRRTRGRGELGYHQQSIYQ